MINLPHFTISSNGATLMNGTVTWPSANEIMRTPQLLAACTTVVKKHRSISGESNYAKILLLISKLPQWSVGIYSSCPGVSLTASSTRRRLYTKYPCTTVRGVRGGRLLWRRRNRSPGWCNVQLHVARVEFLQPTPRIFVEIQRMGELVGGTHGEKLLRPFRDCVLNQACWKNRCNTLALCPLFRVSAYHSNPSMRATPLNHLKIAVVHFRQCKGARIVLEAVGVPVP